MHRDVLLKDLNEGQRKAVLHREGAMLVTAGPGSGKTHVIITRLLYMIHVYRIPPEKIIVITFTKEAAKSMSSRFLKIYRKECSIVFGTFHSFYYQIIRSISKYSQYRLVHEKEKKYILSKVISEPDQDKKEDMVDCLLRAISYYKNTEDIVKAAEMSGLSKEVLQEHMFRYEQEKSIRKVLDFDDMIYLCMKLLQGDSKLLKKWQERFAYYLVDEFQDCNPVQYKILKMLCGSNLFVVGDDDQAIYGFRGAESQIMQKFAEDHPRGDRVVLGMNYRCSARIVQASSVVIRENKMRMDKDLTAYKAPADEEYVHILKWPNREELLKYFVQLLKAVPEEQLSEHALLLRTNQEMQMFAVELLKRNIPFQMKGKSTSIFDHFVIKDIMAFLDAANGNMDRKLFLRILNKPRRHIGREALEDEIINFRKIKVFYQDHYMCNPAALKDVEELEKHLNHLKKMPLTLGIRYIRKAMGYEKYLIKRAEGNVAFIENWLELLECLQENAAAFQSLQEWKEYQKEYETKMLHRSENSESSQQLLSCIDAKSKGVHIMTLHASKGLEFKHCYILNVNDGMIPKYQKGQKITQEQLEEERRLFYVGMTRAKKTLELHYLTGTKERPKFPSRFIQKLLK